MKNLMTTTTKCIKCGIEIEGKRQYCDNCRIIRRREFGNAYRIAHKKKHYCFYCGKLLSGIGRTKYCLEHSKHKEPKGLCEYCNINPIKYLAKKYCSRECCKQANKHLVIRFCVKCQKDITKTTKHKYCLECGIIAKREQDHILNTENSFKTRKFQYCIICGGSLKGMRRQTFCDNCVPKYIDAPNIPSYVKKHFPDKFVYIPTATGVGREAIFADGMSAHIQKQVPKMIEDTMRKILNEEEKSKRCDKRDPEGWCTLFGNYPKSRILCKYWPEECPILNDKITRNKYKPCPKCGKPINLAGRTCMECSKNSKHIVSRAEW